MKTKLFFAAMAAVAVIGCQKEPNGSVVSDGQASFLKVDLRAAGTLTKADPAIGTYEYGEKTENAVNSIHFYFFESDGDAYPVDGAENNYVIAADGVNWFTEEDGGNVASISDAVLVIKQSKQAPPAQMVVVLNAPAIKVDNLAGLHAQINYLTTTAADKNYFVMSNSVYFDGSAIVDATPIMSENIFAANEFYNKNGDPIVVGSAIPNTEIYMDREGEEPVTVNPVEVYVERVAAKVRVGVAEKAVGENGFITVNGATFKNNPVYAKVLGWQVTNNTAQAPLLKNIKTTWTDDALGFAWNNPTLYRSYWAATTDEPKHDLTFSEIAGLAKDADGNLIPAHNPVYDYYFENTAAYKAYNGVDLEGNAFDNALGSAATVNQAPQLLIAAQLVDAGGIPLQIAKWYGVQYTIEDLKTAMVATVASKIYVKVGDTETYRTITTDDVTFYQVSDETPDNRYEVRVKATEGTTYYNSVSAEATTTAAELLAGISPAQMWTNGYTYYYTTIKHFGAAGKTGEYGIVRNHVYDITIDGVTGFGTPVYNPDEIITPEKPEDDVALNLSARINILQWHIVNQNVTLQ